MKRVKECVVTRVVVLFVVATALLNAGMPRGRAAIAEPRLKSESQIRSEANLYDTAIREIAKIETMPVATADDFKPIRSILERHVPNLRFNRSKLVSVGLSETTFVNAVKARTSDRTKADEFARELAGDNQSIFRLSGAQSIKDKINQSVKNDISLLRRVSQRLQRAADEIKAKSHHGYPTSRFIESPEPNFQGITVKDVLTAVVVTSLVISAAMIIGPLGVAALAVAATGVAGNLYGATLVAGAVALVARVAEIVGTEEGQDKFKECMEGVDARYRQCVQQAGLFGTPACMVNYLIGATRCITVE